MEKWDAIQQEGMNQWLQAQNESADDHSQEHLFITCEIGLTSPLNTFHVHRGATDAELAEELAMLRQVCDHYEHNDYLDKNEATDKYEAELKKFSEASESEIYLVLHDDCQPLDPHIKIGGTYKGRDWSKEFYDEWNVLANWGGSDEPIFKEVWERRKVPYKEACERIKQMKPLEKRKREPFKVQQQYFNNIKNILDKLVDVDLENGPYKVVAEQLQLREQLEQHYAILAAQKMRFLAGGKTYFTASLNPGWDREYKYALLFQQCEYDSWDHWHDFFKQHCKIDEWMPREYAKFPTAYWDLSSDPDFAHAKQKVYPIKLSYYGAHDSGW